MRIHQRRLTNLIRSCAKVCVLFRVNHTPDRKSSHVTVVLPAFLTMAFLSERTFAQSPACEGYGYATRGGEGGDIYHVTTLADGGPGSLRDGMFNRSGPRTIVFDVAGTITFTNLVKLNSPYLTIDGATAPAPGITLTKDIDWTAFIISGTHDIILRHLRFQGLYLRGADDGNNDTAFLAIDGDWDPD